MKIHSLEFSQFRNLVDSKIKLGDRFTLIVGQNAQGKTNLLEVISMLGDLKSFRQAKLEQMINHRQDKAYLACNADAAGLDYEVRLELSKGHRKLKVNAKTVTKQKDYLGSLPVVIFTPDDVRLSQGSPERRRKFLDRTLFLIKPKHWDTLSEYKQILKRRNILLKEQKSNDPLFEIYSKKLAKLGAEITVSRHQITKLLFPLVMSSSRIVSNGADKTEIKYLSYLSKAENERPDDKLPEDKPLDDKPTDDKQTADSRPTDDMYFDDGEKLYAKLCDALKKDRYSGRTSVGPHVEDLQITIDSMLAQSYASQGQHRTIALSLKIAEIEVIKEHRGFYPALLIDDLSSELDAKRRSSLFDYLKATGSQVVLTSTEENIADDFGDSDLLVYTVDKGQVELLQG